MKKPYWYKILSCLLILAVLAGILIKRHGLMLNAAEEGQGSTAESSEDTALTDSEEVDKKGNYSSAGERLLDMEVIASDNEAVLYLDRKNAEFAIQDKRSKEAFFSSPYDFNKDIKSTDDTKKLIQSFIKLTYYDSASQERYMNSYADCISKNQFTIESIENGFAINMQIGRIEDSILVPDAAEAVRFEEKVISQLSERDAKKVLAYYTKISMNDSKITEAVKEGYLKYYPGLRNKDFYILRGVVEREKKQIEAIIAKTEYSLEDLQEDLEDSGYVSDEVISALFDLTVLVQLDNGDLLVSIPTEKISYNSKDFKLADFSLLEFFGAGKSSSDGYLFVPDGSGALINYNTNQRKTALYTTNTVYGRDYTFSAVYSYNSLSEQIYMPVYGNMDGSKAYLAIIEEGESLADIISESGNIISSYETIFPEFKYHPSNTINYTDTVKVKGFYTYYANKPYEGTYTVRYKMLSGSNADYVGMAKAYQKYLVEKGELVKLTDNESDAVLYLETLGKREKAGSFLGFPYTESITFTTFSQAESMLKEFNGAGIGNIALRYKAYMNGGVYYSVSNQADIESVLGGKKGLKALESYADANNIKLYPDVDFNIVRKDTSFDGFSEKKMAQTVAKEKLWLTTPQEITSLAYLQYAFYSVSPYYFKGYMKEFFKDYNKLGLSSVSIGNYGTMLYAEYNKKRNMSRETVKDVVFENTKAYTENMNLMIDGGNAYMLSLADDIINVPMTNSSHTLEDASVPFMQLVLHGYVNYGGKAFNLSSNHDEMFLKSIEYGSNLFFTLAHDNLGELKLTTYTYYFSIGYNEWKDKVIEYSSKFNEAYNGLNNLTMTKHEQLENNVYKTSYENGTYFIVNYNDYDVEVNGIAIKALDFVKVNR